MTTSTSPHYKPSKELVPAKDQEGNKWFIKPNSLDIIWGGDGRYWDIPQEETKPVELRQVSWLEVTGSLDLRHLPKNCALKFKFHVQLKSDAFGWKNNPVYLMARLGRTYSWKKYDLSLLPKDKVSEVPQYPTITVPSTAPSQGKIQFGMYEIWTGTWKGGLFIHGVVIEAQDAR